MISTAHIIFGNSEAKDPERVVEVEVIAKFLSKRADSKGAWSANTILLGDYNNFSRGSDNVTYGKFDENGFKVPEAMQSALETNVGKKKRYYDQIALRNLAKILVPTGRTGVFDYLTLCTSVMTTTFMWMI